MSDKKANIDWLDDLLRQETDYVDDKGFTARVLAALPETRLAWYASRSFVLLAATVLASVIALLIPGLAGYVVGSLVDIVTLKPVSAARLAVLVPVALFYWAGLSAATAER